MTQIVSKCGIHCIGSDRHNYRPFLQTIAKANRKLSLVKCRDDFGAISEPLDLWPDVLCIGAFTQFDRLPFSFDKFAKRAALNPRVKVWEVLNEDDAPSTYSAKADLYMALAPKFAERGWSLCMFNCSSGTPRYPSEDGGASYGEIARACKFMKDNGYPAYLGLHEYNSDGGTLGRFKVLADYLEAHNALIPIVITEYGLETNKSDADYLSFVKKTDPIYMADKRVVGCALWTLGGSGWQGSNYDNMLPALGAYIATVSGPVTPPAPPPPDIDRVIAYHGTCLESKWADVAAGVVAAGGTIERVTA